VQASIVFLFLFNQRVVFIQVAVHPSQFQGLDSNHLVFRSAFLASDYIAFFHFVQFDIKGILAFRAACHSSLLSLKAFRLVGCRGLTVQHRYL